MKINCSDGVEYLYEKKRLSQRNPCFLLQELDIKPEIADIFFLNKESTSPVVIKFSTLEDKQAVFDNIGKLKGLINEEGKPFFISHYLPANLQFVYAL